MEINFLLKVSEEEIIKLEKEIQKKEFELEKKLSLPRSKEEIEKLGLREAKDVRYFKIKEYGELAER